MSFNKMEMTFSAISENEGFARMAVAAFMMAMNPTMEELADVKTAVSEAVTNSIVHGYQEKGGDIALKCQYTNGELTISISDKGTGIKCVEEALQPFFTTAPEKERTGMGFAFMEAFMDDLKVESSIGEGTTVIMKKSIMPNSTEINED